MKAPRTSNSITDRVIYTGLYVPEHAPEAKREEDTRTVAPSVVSAASGASGSKKPALQA